MEEGGYAVTVPALHGCISVGDTIGESLENIKDAITGIRDKPPEALGNHTC